MNIKRLSVGLGFLATALATHPAQAQNDHGEALRNILAQAQADKAAAQKQADEARQDAEADRAGAIEECYNAYDTEAARARGEVYDIMGHTLNPFGNPGIKEAYYQIGLINQAIDDAQTLTLNARIVVHNVYRFDGVPAHPYIDPNPCNVAPRLAVEALNKLLGQKTERWNFIHNPGNH